MNFDGYAQYMIQKYRLAVALAVIKTRPSDTDIREHLNAIKNKINESKMDSNDEIAICEEDFEFNDNDCEMNDIHNESNESVTILKDYHLNLDCIDEENKGTDKNSFFGVSKMTRSFDEDPDDENMADTIFFEESQINDLTFCESPTGVNCNDEMIQAENNDITNDDDYQINDIMILNNHYDSQQTELYTLPDMNTHISQSQDHIMVSEKYFNTKAKKNCMKTLDSKVNVKMEHQYAQIHDHSKSHPNVIELKNIEQLNITNPNNSLGCGQKENKVNGEEIPHIRDRLDSNVTLDGVNKVYFNSKISQEFNNGENKFIPNTNQCTCSASQDGQNIFRNTQTAKKITSLSQNLYSLDEFEYYSTQSSKNSVLNTHFNYNGHESMRNDNETKEVLPEIDDKFSISDDSNSDDLTESQAEIVTFKVLEELSKIKSYLNKTENSSSDTDSGYRSLRTKGSHKSALQLSGCYNESAHCLYSFLINSPLVVNIMDISEEISKVLGKFIDRLHDEEKYPKFMEELLEMVDVLINDIYNFKIGDDDTMLQTDERIHRILLLNRSTHIIKFSIEKITLVLEKLLPELKGMMEITETERTENLCHIFHILEILLKRFISYDKCSSQTSVQSQGTALKKSSITEIWRKKWNLSKCEVFQVDKVEKCVVTECRMILNRIIVEAMDGYSLISFAALQCFNVLQK